MGNPFRAAGRLSPVLRVLLLLLALGLAAFLVLEGIVIAGGRSELKQDPDAVIILGCKLWGEEPSPALERRLTAALDYLEELEAQGVTPLVVVSGGQGEDEPMTEAACMAAWLEENGLDESRILQEGDSRNTIQNLRYSQELLAQAGLERPHITIVSNDFHLARVRMLAGRCGLDCSTLAAPMPDLSSRIYSTLREAPALVKSFLLDR